MVVGWERTIGQLRWNGGRVGKNNCTNEVMVVGWERTMVQLRWNGGRVGKNNCTKW